MILRQEKQFATFCDFLATLTKKKPKHSLPLYDLNKPVQFFPIANPSVHGQYSDNDFDPQWLKKLA